jgi:hypothetical protein
MIRRTDTSKHTIAVNDGADLVGTLVECAGKFDAYTADGRFLGTFNDLRAARAAATAQIGEKYVDDNQGDTQRT